MKFSLKNILKSTPAIVLSIGYTLSSATALAAQFEFSDDPKMQKVLFACSLLGLLITHSFHKPTDPQQ